MAAGPTGKDKRKKKKGRTEGWRGERHQWATEHGTAVTDLIKFRKSYVT